MVTAFFKENEMWMLLALFMQLPCSPANHDRTCYDTDRHRIVSHLYAFRTACETNEGVACMRLCDSWAPIGKPVFVDTSNPLRH